MTLPIAPVACDRHARWVALPGLLAAFHASTQVSVADNVADCDILAVVARPLHELDWAEYLDIKLREFAQSDELQRTIDAQAFSVWDSASVAAGRGRR